MEASFQLLDATYEVSGRETRILIYARMEDGSRALLVVKGFRPYFYAIPEQGSDLASIKASIARLSSPSSPIVGIDIVEKKYYGREVRALRIETMIPQEVRRYREEVAKLRGISEVLEADIRFTMRYLIDKNLYPMRWYTAKLRELPKLPSYRVDSVYEVQGELEEDPGRVNVDPLEGLRVMAFDIEAYNPGRSPEPTRDPVIIIGYWLKPGMAKPELLEAEGMRDKRLISEFVSRVNELDPDIIVGYNQNRFDWPYLVRRAKVNSVTLDVGRRVGSTPQTSTYGHISINGRLNVDLFDFAQEMPGVKVKSLEEVADYLGVMPKSKRSTLEWWQIADYWKKGNKDPLLRYAFDDVYSTMLLAEKLLPFGTQLSLVSGLPLDQVMAASVGFRLEWRLMREAFKLGELVPNRTERVEESYTGAVVLKPKPGLHDNIAVLDFASMYPNIMVKYNVGPDTLVRPGEAVDEYYEAPEVGHRYRKNPPGFFKLVLEKLLNMRKRLREEARKYPYDSIEYRLLDERQKAVKLLANASYGYMGWVHARWYCRECAESVTSWGRSLILRSIGIAKELGLGVIYGDTDSLFVTYDEDKVRRLVERVEKELGFDIKLEKVYLKVFFTEAKKRYIGLTTDGKIDVVGFEAVRGDWSELAKEAQLVAAEIILKTGDVEKAVEYIRGIIEDLRARKIAIDKLVIWKTLTRRPEEYEAEQPHVSAARIMERKGYRIEPGMKIGYIIVRGPGPLHRRAKPYFMVSPEEIDVNYYIEKQIIPSALRILGYFGISEKRLRGGGQASLLDFMK